MTASLVKGVLEKDRMSIARAITLVESSNPDHQKQASELLDALLPYSGKSIRVGISGTPGVGKSTFIEALGLWLIGNNQQVAVLAVDPTSPMTKGSLLGDKTRMQRLSLNPSAYIRPSPTQGVLGGVAAKTREAMVVCEAAGFDVILVETVGVGQSEIAVVSMVDTFILLIQPGSGDELQGIKKGILELADILVVNKADGELEWLADLAKSQYARAFFLLRRAQGQPWKTPVIKASALESKGIVEIWKQVESHRAHLEFAEGISKKRSKQAEQWFWNRVEAGLLDNFKKDPKVASALPLLLEQVKNNRMSVSHAVSILLSSDKPGRIP